MRKILAATLLLSSALCPAIASAATMASDADAAQPVRVSTGVIAPTLADTLNLDLPSALNWTPLPYDASVGVSLIVDEKGNTHNVEITKSLNRFWDARVVAAVEKAHYHPASIDQQNIPMAVNLVISIAR
jgi:hypothetical protein